MSELLQDVSIILTASMLLSLGFVAFNLPPLLGYILTGTIIGPTLTIIENPEILHIMGEFGLILLLFLVGLEISLEDFKKAWVHTLLFLICQFLGSTIIAWIAMIIFGWSSAFALFIAFLLTVSSTAVVITLLENMNILQSKTGSFAVSILIAQDLALMPMILIVRSLGSTTSGISNVISLFFALILLVFAILYFGKQTNTSYNKLYYKNLLKRPEVTTLIGASICFTCAASADWIGLSPAYGSFLAGLMLGNRWDRDSLVRAFLPITSMMMTVFFLSVGFRISISFIAENILIIFIGLTAIVLAKLITNICGLLVIKWPIRSTFFVAALLAQMSEFAFVLIDEANKVGLLNSHSINLLISLTTLSLAFGSGLPLLVQSLQSRSKDN